MKSYKFKARDKNGNVKEGVIKADSHEQARARFRDMGMILISLKEQGGGDGGGFMSAFAKMFAKVKLSELMIFTRQMAALSNAGIPLVASLKSLETTTENKAFRAVLADVRKDIEAGASFSNALKKHPKVFSNIYSSSISAGEASGSLPEVLMRLAFTIERDKETRDRIKQAMGYPIIIIVVIIIALFVIGIVIIPKFESMFLMFNVDELPVVTQILMTTSAIMRGYWYLFMVAVVIGVFLFKHLLTIPVFKYMFDNVVLRLPVLGELYKKISLGRFTRTIATLVRSGVPIIETIELASKTTNNVVLNKAMNNIKEKVKEGRSIAVSMSEETVFPPMIIQMVSAGEESGRIDELMEMVADFYDNETDIMVKNLTTLIEPILLMFIAGIVVVLALGIFLPLWNLQSSIK